MREIDSKEMTRYLHVSVSVSVTVTVSMHVYVCVLKTTDKQLRQVRTNKPKSKKQIQNSMNKKRENVGIES